MLSTTQSNTICHGQTIEIVNFAALKAPNDLFTPYFSCQTSGFYWTIAHYAHLESYRETLERRVFILELIVILVSEIPTS